MFLRVPQYLADLRSLPRRGLYWGPLGRWGEGANFNFIVGFCMTLSRDVVQQFVSYKPLQRLVRLPYSKAREADFLSLNMEHEDVMVGRALHEVKYPELTLVRESRCSFHDLRYGCRRRSLSDTSVVIHHIKSRDYMKLMRRFSNGTAATAREYRRLPRSLWFHC
ncbi:putative UDP-Gal or UDP-GlcNAc-dependent glycosyltransferase [Trypanosoma grayi]|uniref:putative UDP-Gal or UDP-GlcNAc-dependent glycosyltransferase n=1 Tax=Trypanosoma grayi TaxID=71804 RepID=UPI0004F475CE|nr:putative UDP-Gal or UDP-GlcNAc-dependent glycosyltransferase [Trypanosoma grayi]KEG05857.1 putative UDP-Gal or UDP-GlcNAc-dependent glycosyltransferase [Trypanosoma grayi]